MGPPGICGKGWERARFTSFVELLPAGYVYQSTAFVIPLGGEADLFQPHRPNCGAADIAFQGSTRESAPAALYVLSPARPLDRETWLCG